MTGSKQNCFNPMQVGRPHSSKDRGEADKELTPSVRMMVELERTNRTEQGRGVVG